MPLAPRTPWPSSVCQSSRVLRLGSLMSYVTIAHLWWASLSTPARRVSVFAVFTSLPFCSHPHVCSPSSGALFLPSTTTNTVTLRCSDGVLNSSVSDVKVSPKAGAVSAGQSVTVKVDMFARTLVFISNGEASKEIALPVGMSPVSPVHPCASDVLFVQVLWCSVLLASFVTCLHP